MASLSYEGSRQIPTTRHRSFDGRIALSCEDYQVGWICALESEFVAARAVLDREHEHSEHLTSDDNYYVYGSIGTHNVVITSLPSGSYGTNAAARTASRMLHSFENLRVRLMVGIGGGVPSTTADIRLGDVVVSNPGPKSNGVIQYDLGKSLQGQKWPQRSYQLNKPPEMVRNAVAGLRSRQRLYPGELSILVGRTIQRYPSLAPEYLYPGETHDKLFNASYLHEGDDDCDLCDDGKKVSRRPRANSDPRVFYGTIASGNQVMRNAVSRDYWRDEEDVLCFEMEAAGLMDDFQCLVIRGVCDYSDSHKNKRFQPYASLVAAAYARLLLEQIVSQTERSSAIASKQDDLCIRPVPQVQQPELKTRYDEKAKTKIILQALSYPLIHQREELINDAYARTFEWLLRGSYEDTGDWRGSGFVEWLRQDSEYLFWISGKPGSGKSTLMNNLFKDVRLRQNLKYWTREDDLVMASFYFFDSGVSALQKSQNGLLRSILHQVCTQRPNLVEETFSSTWTALDQNEHERPINWTNQQLIQALRRVMQKAQGSFKLFLHVDGLDEYSPSSLLDDELVTFETSDSNSRATERSSGHTEIAQLFCEAMTFGNIKICVSSRPLQRFYDAFEDQRHLKLDLLTQPDIEYYVQQRFANNVLTRRTFARAPGELREIVNEVVSRAEGVFLWVKIVTTNLIDQVYERASSAQIREQINSMPVELGGPRGLFMKVLRDIRPKFLVETIRLILLILRAHRQPDTMLLKFAGEKVQRMACAIKFRPPDAFEAEEDSQRMQEWIRARGGGLLDFSNNPHDKVVTDRLPVFPVVRFIHKTVGDFFQMDSTWDALNGLLDAGSPKHYEMSIEIELSLLCGYTKYLKSLLPAEGPDTLADLRIRSIIAGIKAHAKRSAHSFPSLVQWALDELDGLATQTFEQYSITSGDCPRVSIEDVGEQRHEDDAQKTWIAAPFQYRDRAFPWWLAGENFLSHCIRLGLFEYATTKIKNAPSLVMDKTGVPLLQCALDRSPREADHQVSIFRSYATLFTAERQVWPCNLRTSDPSDGVLPEWPSLQSSPSMIKTLLDHGADPNRPWAPHGFPNWRLIPWITAISAYQTYRAREIAHLTHATKNLPQEVDECCQQWLEIVKLLIDRDADFSNPIIILDVNFWRNDEESEAPRSYSPHLRSIAGAERNVLAYSSLFLAASTLSNLPKERKLLLQLLSRKGSKFVQGEILELLAYWKIPATELSLFQSCVVSMNHRSAILQTAGSTDFEITKALEILKTNDHRDVTGQQPSWAHNEGKRVYLAPASDL